MAEQSKLTPKPNPDAEGCLTVILVIGGMILGGILGELNGEGDGNIQTEALAVQHGYAHWAVSPNGKSTFYWNNEPTNQP
jgi:uncharacterized protein YcfJ